MISLSKLSRPFLRNCRFMSSYPSHDLVPMPALSPTMEAGTIAGWLIKEGEGFSPGDAICEVETDKATVTFDATDEGFLAKILVGTGEIKVGEPLMITVEEESDIAAFKDYVPPIVSTTASESVATSSSAETPLVSSSSSSSSDVVIDRKGPVRYSPAARHLAESKSIDISKILGTARHGLVSKEDVIIAIKNGTTVKLEGKTATSTVASTTALSSSSVSSSSSSPAAAAIPITLIDNPPVNEKYEDIPNSNMRKIIAKRLTESKATVPHSYTSIECEIDSLLQFRKKLKSEMDINVSVNDMVIKSAALALRDVPEANGKWNGSNQVYSDAVDISVAVATPSGLITPIVTGADKRGVQNINSCVKDLAGRARDGKLKPEEYQGGSFTISNLGMFGISNFSAVINPPQACILAVGGGVSRVLPPQEGATKPRVATTLTVELSADRRVVDDAIAAQYLRAFKSYLSSPTSILL